MPNRVMRWGRKYGSGKYGKLIRVEKADEVNEATRLRSQLGQAKEALADAHMELALEKAFLEVACEQMGQTTEAFKKSMLEGGAARAGNQPPVQSDWAVRVGRDDSAKLLRAQNRSSAAASRFGADAG